MNDPDRYTHNKFFIITISLGIILSIFLASIINSSDSAGWLLVFMVIPYTVGFIFYWPIDYFVHRRTIKQMKGKPRTIDPNFKLKRAILIAAVIIVSLIIYAVNFITHLNSPY